MEHHHYGDWVAIHTFDDGYEHLKQLDNKWKVVGVPIVGKLTLQHAYMESMLRGGGTEPMTIPSISEWKVREWKADREYKDRATPTRGACRTGGFGGKAANFLNKAAAKAKGAKFALGDQYWKSANTDITKNLASQHKNFLSEHTAHAREWASGLAHLLQDLKAANGKATKTAEDEIALAAKKTKIKEKMDVWLKGHDYDPLAKVEQMFKFRLGGLDAEERLTKLAEAVEKAKQNLGKLDATRATAVETAQGYVKKVVKEAIEAGWEASQLANRNSYL